ncbi:Holliday junction resolvase RecU [Lysinibacillus odysseyi]|uniref:Holliday junction resolvase RecU n=1 Tax=Lysinibacillus odysseyi TaxID=202611 RepID=UPI00068E5EEE|nr:Holliday junction resolvase RecU [Lysinibacillus odysseyi]
MKKQYSRGHTNRGSKLEMLINMTNNEYRSAGFADIRKIPTPTNIAKVEGKKVEAYLDKATWVDYSGIYKSHALIFEAKESTIERFTLANLVDHQYELLKSWHKHGAVAFLIVAFWLKNKNEPEIYYLKFEQLADFWEQKDRGGSKSIPISYFRENCQRIKGRDGFTAHYLLAAGLHE